MSTIAKFKNMVFCEHLCVVSQLLSQFLASLHEPSGLFVCEQKLFQNVFSDLYSTSKITYVENGTSCVTTLSPHVQNLKNMSSQHRLWSGVTCNPPEKMQTSFEKLVTKTAVLELSFENSSSKLQFWSCVFKTRRQNCSFIVEFSKLVGKTAVLMTSFEKCHQKKIPSSFAKLVTKTAVLELSFENSSSKLQFWWRVLKSFSIFVRTHCRVFPLSEHHF